MSIDGILARGTVIPVIVLADAEQAVPLARALSAGGIGVVEITLRTQAALEGVRRLRAELLDVIVGVGTITRPTDLEHAIKSGAQFGVSPGASPTLLDAVRDSGLPFLPGAMTPSEVLRLRESGYVRQKLFPAQQAGGVGMLKALGSVFPDVRFCPTGGIDADSAKTFLDLPNVACVGGSWLTPPGLVAAGDWEAIRQLALQASGLRQC